jgi:hypothetical protein
VQLSARTARLLFWTGDRLLRFAAVAGAMLITLLLLLTRESTWQRADLHRAWVPDGVWVDLAVAGEIAAGHGFRLDDPAGMPAQRHTLWRAMVGVVSRVAGPPERAARGLSLLAALTLLVVVFRAARTATGSSLIAAGATLALAPSAPFLHLAGSPGPEALAALLAALAVDLHLRSLHDDGRPLSPWLALPLGLAVMLRLEFALLWPLFVVHAMLDAVVERRGRERLALCLWHAAAGVLLMALCLWPLVNLNVRLFGNPWPAAEAALTGLDAGWREWVAGPGRSGWPVFLITAAGLGALLAPPHAREGFRFALFPGLLLLAPPLTALPGRDLGAGGAEGVADALRPIALAFGVVGLVRLAGRLAGARALPAQAAAALALAVALAAHGWSATAEESRWRAAAARERAEAAQALGDPAGPVATDRPGWVRHGLGRPVIDLTAETSIAWRGFITPPGRVDPFRAGIELLRQPPAALWIADASREDLLSRLDGLPWQQRWMSDRGWPRVWR